MANSQTGPDPRWQIDPSKWEDEQPMNSYGVLSGNLLVPVSAFKLTGGFDENIEGRGQDGEFGRNLVAHNVPGIYSQRVIGYHISHYKDPVWETKSVIETIKYIGKKYNLKLEARHFPVVPEEE